MKPIKINIDKIKNNPNNPRIIKDYKFDKLVKSIEEFPEMLRLRPIVVDENNVILGGNMRYKAAVKAGLKEIYAIQALDLTDKQKLEFIIKDNSNFGEWDWDVLANDWDSAQLADWGLDAWQNMDDIETSDTFNLPDGEKEPLQQQTYILADQQAEQIKNAIAKVKKTEEFKYIETFGNSNMNGNGLYLIIMQWVEQNK